MDDTGAPNALSVSELNRQARLMLERGFGDCWVEAPVSAMHDAEWTDQWRRAWRQDKRRLN